jgi:hypothetical protein
VAEDTRHEIATKKVVYEMPGTEAVTVRRDEVYRATGAGPLTMDLYYPPGAGTGARHPAIVIVLGFSGARTPNPLGCSFKEMEWSISWGRLIAASGIVAIVYANREPEADAQALLHYIREHAEALSIDQRRVGLFATSGHVPLALWLLMQERNHLACAVLGYGFMLDPDGSAGVAEAAAQWGFVASAGKSVDDLPEDVPLLVVRAGQDQFPQVNATIDRFVGTALERNLPVTLVNHATGPHSFDLLDDSDRSRAIIRQMLAFMRQCLQVASPSC